MQAFVGPMFSGKTEALHGQLRRQAHAGRIVVLFRHIKDTRDQNNTTLSAHDGGSSFDPGKLPGKNYFEWVESSVDVLQRAHELGADVVSIDEGQFFDDGLPAAMLQLYQEGKKVFYAGLDTDWQGKLFETTLKVMACPEVNIHKMTAVCSTCGSETATRSLKKDAASADPSQRIDPGGKDKYEAACLSCFSKVMESIKLA